MRKPRARNLPLSILFFSSLCLAFFALPAWAGSVPRVTQIAELTASDGATDHSFGMSVAIGGNIIAAGAPGNFLGAGAAYVFVRPSSGWTNANQTAELESTSAALNLGDSVATNGSTVIAGAPVTGTNQLISSADVYVEGGTGWGDMPQTATLTTSNPAIEAFGHSSAMAPSGNILLIGAPYNIPGIFDGAVGLFKKPADGWVNETQSGVLLPQAGVDVQDFGFSIALSGSTVVVSDPYVDGIGAVFVYELVGGRLTEVAELTTSDGVAGDQLGWSVAISGNTVAVGAPNHAGVGAAYVFVEPATGWTNMTQTAKLTGSSANSGADLGLAVAVDGNVIVAGAPGIKVGLNANQGAIYGFTKPGSGWTNMTENLLLVASDGGADDFLGFSVAAGSGVVASGAFGKDSFEGAVYVFARP